MSVLGQGLKTNIIPQSIAVAVYATCSNTKRNLRLAPQSDRIYGFDMIVRINSYY
jgi:hypothetical protein